MTNDEDLAHYFVNNIWPEEYRMLFCREPMIGAAVVSHALRTCRNYRSCDLRYVLGVHKRHSH